MSGTSCPRAAFLLWRERVPEPRERGWGHVRLEEPTQHGGRHAQGQVLLIQPLMSWHGETTPSNPDHLNNWCGINILWFLGTFQYLWVKWWLFQHAFSVQLTEEDLELAQAYVKLYNWTWIKGPRLRSEPKMCISHHSCIFSFHSWSNIPTEHLTCLKPFITPW